MVKGWHFVALGEDGKPRLRTGELVEAGWIYETDEKPVLCKSGLHASRRALDALRYAHGPIVCRVELTRNLVHDTDKSVGQRREVLAMANVHKLLVGFACDCAERALHRQKKPDPGCVEAIAVTRRWLQGQASLDDVRTARRAADAAADAAATYAAYAAYAAAAHAAATSASASASAAATHAAATSATSAERRWQRRTLEQRLRKAIG